MNPARKTRNLQTDKTILAPITRRAFLANAAIAACGLPLYAQTKAAKPTHSCIVVGAGFAGPHRRVSAHRRGMECHRARSPQPHRRPCLVPRFPQAPELVCEMGGEWIGKDHKQILALAKELNVPARAPCLPRLAAAAWTVARARGLGFLSRVALGLEALPGPVQALHRAGQAPSRPIRLVDMAGQDRHHRQRPPHPRNHGFHRLRRIHPPGLRLRRRRGIR